MIIIISQIRKDDDTTKTLQTVVKDFWISKAHNTDNIINY